jgi:hypothetical protein
VDTMPNFLMCARNKNLHEKGASEGSCNLWASVSYRQQARYRLTVCRKCARGSPKKAKWKPGQSFVMNDLIFRIFISPRLTAIQSQ